MNQLCLRQKKLITYLKIEMGKRVKLWQLAETEKGGDSGRRELNFIIRSRIFLIFSEIMVTRNIPTAPWTR